MTASATAFWERRHATMPELVAVGHTLVGEPFNRWMYRVRAAVFRAAVGPRLDRRRDLSVLDVGSGSGFYVQRWRELGVADVTASDLAPSALVRLRRRDPTLPVLAFDVADPAGPRLDRRFDAVSALDVLFHLVDDDAHARAIANLAALVRPGGFLVLSENLRPDGDRRVSHTQVDRAARRTLALLDRAGFDVVARRAMFVLMNEPQNSTSRLRRAWWAGLSRLLAAHPAAGAVVGPPLYVLERLLVSRGSPGASTELVVCRRR